MSGLGSPDGNDSDQRNGEDSKAAHGMTPLVREDTEAASQEFPEPKNAVDPIRDSQP